VTAKRLQVPGTIDVRQPFEQPDEPHPEHGRDREECRGAPECAQRWVYRRRDDRREREGDDAANRPAPARVQARLYPPAVRADPALTEGIEEQCVCDSRIDVGRGEQDEDWNEECERPTYFQPP
jgi:hypothetical protein